MKLAPRVRTSPCLQPQRPLSPHFRETFVEPTNASCLTSDQSIPAQLLTLQEEGAVGKIDSFRPKLGPTPTLADGSANVNGPESASAQHWDLQELLPAFSQQATLDRRSRYPVWWQRAFGRDTNRVLFELAPLCSLSATSMFWRCLSRYWGFLVDLASLFVTGLPSTTTVKLISTRVLDPSSFDLP